MSNSRMRAPALVGVATVRGARGAPGPTPMRARGTKRGPTSVPAPHHILAEVSSDVDRAPSGGQLLWSRGEVRDAAGQHVHGERLGQHMWVTCLGLCHS